MVHDGASRAMWTLESIGEQFSAAGRNLQRLINMIEENASRSNVPFSMPQEIGIALQSALGELTGVGNVRAKLFSAHNGLGSVVMFVGGRLKQRGSA